VKKDQQQGFTLVEVLIAIAVIAAAVLVVYGEMMQSYRFLYQARGRMEAQSIAFDRLWEVYNWDYTLLGNSQVISTSTSTNSMFGTNGVIRVGIVSQPLYSDVTVQVWGLSTHAITTNALVEYSMRRYSGGRG